MTRTVALPTTTMATVFIPESLRRSITPQTAHTDSRRAPVLEENINRQRDELAKLVERGKSAHIQEQIDDCWLDETLEGEEDAEFREMYISVGRMQPNAYLLDEWVASDFRKDCSSCKKHGIRCKRQIGPQVLRCKACAKKSVKWCSCQRDYKEWIFRHIFGLSGFQITDFNSWVSISHQYFACDYV